MSGKYPKQNADIMHGVNSIYQAWIFLPDAVSCSLGERNALVSVTANPVKYIIAASTQPVDSKIYISRHSLAFAVVILCLPLLPRS
jgi:hypothetical protein